MEACVGKIIGSLTHGSKALLVHAHDPGRLDDRSAIWDVPEATVLHCPKQVWVHVNYRTYRRTYVRAFPEAALGGLVLDHVMNRRVAASRASTFSGSYRYREAPIQATAR
jgi:hypothetical protein